jgi:hypothetical protein
MAQDGRDILEILRFELSFLQDGGYGRSPHAPWRAPAVFEDSPICPNFCDPARPHPCESCLLEQFVPEGRRTEAVPCRFIQLTKEGESVDDLYRTGTQADLEEALAAWLCAQIARIEKERGIKPKQAVVA